MKIHSRPINAGETFCTSIKHAKSIFSDTDVTLDFGAFSRYYAPHKNEIGFGYYDKKIEGSVVAQMILHRGVDCSQLHFFVVKNEHMSLEMKKIFEDQILQKLFEMYNQHCASNFAQQKDTVIWVELLNDKFYIHKYNA